jgi:hypothetical protein
VVDRHNKNNDNPRMETKSVGVKYNTNYQEPRLKTSQSLSTDYVRLEEISAPKSIRSKRPLSDIVDRSFHFRRSVEKAHRPLVSPQGCDLPQEKSTDQER